MKRTVVSVFALAALAVTAARAGIVLEVDAEKSSCTVTVTGHETTNKLSADQVATLASYELVKKGSGTLYAGDELKAFAGKITIAEGYYNIQTTNALGTAAGETFVDGGTLINSVNNWQTNGSAPSFGKEVLHLKGTGCQGNGAVQNKIGNTDFCRNVVFEGDTTINTAGCRLDLRCTTLNMKGYDLTVNGYNGDFYFVAFTMKNPGNITMNGGTFEFQSSFNCNPSCAGKTLTLNNGAWLSLWNSPSWVEYKVIFNKGSQLVSPSGAFKECGTDNRNILSGTNVLNGPINLSIVKNGQIQLRGYVTGEGGLCGKALGYLQFSPSTGITNDFTGGLAVKGFVTNGCPQGGVVVYNNRSIPTEGGPLALTNAVLWKNTQDVLALPDVVVDGCSWITSSVASTSISTAKSLTKTGADALTVNLPLKINGATEIEGGTLCFGQQIPAHPAGLNWTYNRTDSGSLASDGGVDATGAAYAYKAWPSGKSMNFTYTGFIRVPGEEGQEVKCNWMTSIARAVTVTIDGVTCADFNDNKNVKDGITVGYLRLAMYKPVTLKAGWRKVTVKMSNWWDSTRGPQANTTLGWAANFGIGVDWQARCVTNTAYYAKLLDPGDGSFLRASNNADDKVALADKYRPSFGGSVAFAGGSVLDLNDYEPFAALTIPELIGLPTLTNGAVKVTSKTWTLRVADVLSGVPLTIAENASLQFGDEDSVVTITGEGAAWRKALKRAGQKRVVDLLLDKGTTPIKNAFVLDAGLVAEGWMLVKKGNVWQLVCDKGLQFIVK